MEAKQDYYQTPGHNIAAGVALSLLTVFIVGVRFQTRRKQGQHFGWDDWLIVPAAVSLDI